MRTTIVICAGIAAMAVVALAPVSRAQDSQWMNVERVSACLSGAPAHPEGCIPVLSAPCSHHAETGFLRACLYRLRQRWEQAIAPDGSVRRLPYDAVCMASLGETLGFEPQAVRERRNTCRLFTTALAFFGLRAARDSAFASDVESVEACVLETAHVGIEASCFGLLSDFCRADGIPMQTCEARERAVWQAIHIAHGGRGSPYRPLDALAEMAMQTLIAAETTD